MDTPCPGGKSRWQAFRASPGDLSEPWSDYSRYALWECLDNLAAGEDIRYVSRERAMAVGLPVALPGYDYWLFDSRRLVRLHYDEADDLLHSEVMDDPAAIVQHNYWRNAAWHYALPRDEYVQQVGEPVEPPSPATCRAPSAGGTCRVGGFS